MKKLFISQPMEGKSDAEIEQERQEAVGLFNVIAFAHKKEPFAVSPLVDEEPPYSGNADLWYLGKSLELMSQADAVVFCPGWQQAKECRIERECLKLYMADTPFLVMPDSSLWRED